MKYNITNLEKFKTKFEINQLEITQQIKPVKFMEETAEAIVKISINLIENKIKELIKPFIDVYYYEFKPYQNYKMVEILEDQGYKFGCLEDDYYSTYYIKNKTTKEIDYFSIKKNTEIELEDNNYKATTYISDIVRGIKD